MLKVFKSFDRLRLDISSCEVLVIRVRKDLKFFGRLVRIEQLNG